MKCKNIQIIGILEGEEKEQGIENLFGKKKMTENFPNLERGKAMQNTKGRGESTKGSNQDEPKKG